MTREPTVFVVEDDEQIRHALHQLIESIYLQVESYASAEAFLDAYEPDRPGCLVLDLRMPGMGGLALQDELLRRDILLPVIIVTGFADVPTTVRAMTAGALVVLEKPFNDLALLEYIQKAIDKDAKQRRRRLQRATAEERLGSLTPREMQVFELLAAGKSTKQIALQLAISRKTVHIHRSNLMDKLHAESVADIVRLALSRAVV